MKCAKVQELYSAYLENAIEPPMKVALEQHFAECLLCKAGYERFRAATMLLDEMPEVEPPGCFHAAVMARVEQARRTTPHPVRWWSIDWQSVFNARVPVRAVAMAAAILVVLAILVQLSPVGAMVAGLFGGGSDKGAAPGDNSAPPGPLPWRAPHETQVPFGLQGVGLSIGMTMNPDNENQVVYVLKFGSDSGESIPVEAYKLAEVGAAGETARIISGRVSGETGNAVSVKVARSGKPAVVRVRWTYNGDTRNEFIFLPPRFQSSAANETRSLSVPAGTWRNTLSAVSDRFGVVIAVPGSIDRKSNAFEVESASPGSAVYQAILGHGMMVRAQASSVYIVEPIR